MPDLRKELELVKAEAEKVAERLSDAEEKILDEYDQCVGRCEGCTDLIFEDESHSYDRMSGSNFCESCSPSYADLLREPENFYDGEDVYYTPERAVEFVAAHLANGGNLDDKFGLRVLEPVDG